jgi:S-adenosylmethionine synthetase
VNEGLGKKILVSVSYAIGKAKPLMVSAVNEKGQEVFKKSKNTFDFKPLSIIEKLDLRKPIYRNTAAYGHFGREEFPWEKV